MAKAAFVPSHYNINCTSDEMRELCLAMRSWVVTYEVDEVAEVLLNTLVEAFREELGQPPGDPIEPEEGGSLVAAH